jgi:thioredoxin-like negative regulator of GroEL
LSQKLQRHLLSFFAVGTLTSLILGCGPLQSMMGGGGKEAAEAAQGLLKQGDLEGASKKLEEAAKSSPTDLDVAIGVAYTRALAGKVDEADAALAAVEATAGPKLPEVKLRRALLAMQKGDLDKVKEFGGASGLPAGKLLQAEAELSDGNRDAAKGILEGISSDGGPVGATAKQYLKLMGDSNALVAGLAETQALWALGQQKVAVRSVEEPVKAYAENNDDGSEQILLWAGRAAALGQSDVAFKLLDAISVPPPGQAWRVEATRGIAWCADGNGAECTKVFDGLVTRAPADGLSDAKVTAAQVIAERDPATAKALLTGLTGDGAARVLAAMGDKAGAASLAADPILKKQLGG